MSNVAIRCEGLGKHYRIGGRERYRTLRDALADALYAPARRLRGGFKGGGGGAGAAGSENTFWALKNILFDVKHGEVVGVIGRNGAGKSTLLKILSRITRPTEGLVSISGRVGSLLEVGTGFHPELTGRENIYLNGAILGMKKADIERKFDEMVAFAEIGRFLDTPVKRYSSGMYVRLAFAVAAHLEPEILVVDEVLAVGDIQFQAKCLGKMSDVARAGRTVLFVSHNLAAVEALCDRAILLEAGRIAVDGSVSECITSYLKSGAEESSCPLDRRKDRQGLGNIRLQSVDIDAPEGVATGKPFRVRIQLKPAAREHLVVKEIGISVWSEKNVRLISISSEFNGEALEIPVSGWVECLIPSLPLVEGRYVLNAFVVSQAGLEDYVERITVFTVSTGDFFGSGKSVDPEWGMIAVAHRWKVSGD